MTASEPKPRRWPHHLLVAFTVVALLAVSWVLLVFPRFDQAPVDPPRHSDAIFLLGGETYGAEMGYRMLDEGWGDTLVLSWVRTDLKECREGYRGHEVICVRPEPVTTQGEAMLLPQLVETHGWDTVTVATWPAHIPRTRLLVERCYEGEVRYRPTDYHYGRRERLAKAAYETFSFGKAALTPGCDDMLPFGLSD